MIKSNPMHKQRTNTLANQKASVEKRQKYGGPLLKDAILGGQDGVVNVLGIVLGVATATNDFRVIMISGIAATFAESVSMGAVLYTSTKAAKEYYYAELERERKEIEAVPEIEREEIKEIFYNKGFRGKQLNEIVKKITSDKDLWLDTMMTEELRLFPDEYESPIKKGIFVGLAAVVGSVVPLLPFLVMPIKPAMIASVIVAAAVLFAVGVIKAKWFELDWKKSGIEMAVIGTVAALVGYAVGLAFGVQA
ncbi:MAG: VIT1/CCC1 transporter family protein [Candidatus Woesearchaeota archaeon]|jgi:predicted membrane protein (TIGR00267 family)